MPIGRTMAETIALAEQSILTAQPLAQKDTRRPQFHFTPRAMWMNDICAAMEHDGYYHIFYQYDPFHDYCDWATVNACWGHARSRDLIHWEHLPVTLAPSEEEGNCQCVSGSAAKTSDGKPILFYGHTPHRVPGKPAVRKQRAALPLDSALRQWQTIDIGLEPGQSGIPQTICPAWTDMFVFQQDNRTFAIFKEANGLVVEAQNQALTQWQAVGQFQHVQGECPNFIKVADKWVLLRSTYPMTYLIGDFDPEQIQFIASGKAGILDYSYGMDDAVTTDDTHYYTDPSGVTVCRYGAPPAHDHKRGFYATSTFETSDKRIILLGWVSLFHAKGWNNCMSIPRELSIDTAGYLIQTPVTELKKLRQIQHENRNVTIANHCSYEVENLGDSFEIKMTLRVNHAQVDIALGDNPTHPSVYIAYQAPSLTVNDLKIDHLKTDDSDHLHLHILYDKSMVEIFINHGRDVITQVIKNINSTNNLKINAQGADIFLEMLEIDQIDSIAT